MAVHAYSRLLIVTWLLFALCDGTKLHVTRHESRRSELCPSHAPRILDHSPSFMNRLKTFLVNIHTKQHHGAA